MQRLKSGDRVVFAPGTSLKNRNGRPMDTVLIVDVYDTEHRDWACDCYNSAGQKITPGYFKRRHLITLDEHAALSVAKKYKVNPDTLIPEVRVSKYIYTHEEVIMKIYEQSSEEVKQMMRKEFPNCFPVIKTKSIAGFDGSYSLAEIEMEDGSSTSLLVGAGLAPTKEYFEKCLYINPGYKFVLLKDNIVTIVKE